jgi:hypothetical protein
MDVFWVIATSWEEAKPLLREKVYDYVAEKDEYMIAPW